MLLAVKGHMKLPCPGICVTKCAEKVQTRFGRQRILQEPTTDLSQRPTKRQVQA